jgi:hypothetical protein
MPNEKLPVGRPKKNLDVLPDEWQKTVIEMYTYGASDVEIRAYLDISDDLWERWLIEEPIFSRTIKKGRLLSQTWWERNGRLNLENRDFSATLWYMNMRNRFGWADKQHVDHTTKGDKITAPIGWTDGG